MFVPGNAGVRFVDIGNETVDLAICPPNLMLLNTSPIPTPPSTSFRTKSIHRFLVPALLGACCAAGAQAVELGNIRVHSWLGRQLKASVPLVGDDARQSEARCFKASLMNLNQEVVSALKVTLQHSASSSLLLLAGGNAVDEPAASVRVENVCGTGERRDYAVLLDLVPESQAAASRAAVSAPLAAPPDEAEKSEPVVEQAPSGMPNRAPADTRQRIAQSEPVTRKNAGIAPMLPYTILVSGLKLAAMLPDPENSRARPASHSPASRGSSHADASPGALLKLDRSLAKAVPKSADKRGASGPVAGKDDASGDTATLAAVLAFLAISGAAAWIVMRLREMRAAAKPWMPVDMVLDARAEESGADAAARS